LNIDISGRHMQMTAGMEAHVRDKLGKVEQHFPDGMQSAQVILSIEGTEAIAEMVMVVRGGQLVGRASDDDMYAAIDAAAEKMIRQVTRQKERIQDHRHQRKPGEAAAEAPTGQKAQASDDSDDSDEVPIDS